MLGFGRIYFLYLYIDILSHFVPKLHCNLVRNFSNLSWIFDKNLNINPFDVRFVLLIRGMKMTAELTSEQIVTRLLTSGSIIEPKNDNFYITNPGSNLGEFLLNSKAEQPDENEIKEEPTRYTFIKSKGWDF